MMEVDHVAKTKATIARCVAAKQWAHVAVIGGFKSEHDARMHHDRDYKAANALQSIPAAEPIVYCPRTGNTVSPAPRSWADDIRARVYALGITQGAFSVSMGMAASHLSCVLAPQGHLGIKSKARIENHLLYLEHQLRSVA